MYILGISCYFHDSSASLLKNGLLIAASDEERFSRKKHDSSFPQRAINFCLNQAGITARDLDLVVFYEKPFHKFERLFLSSMAFSPKSLSFFRESMKKWFFDQLWIKNHILNALDIPEEKLIFCEHHLSHAASAYFCSPYQKAAVLTLDAVGEWTTACWGIAEKNSITIKEELRFPQSLGLLYSAFTVFTGFEANEGEYKMMGLAPYGEPQYTDKIKKLLDIKEDGSLATDFSYFSYPYALKEVFTDKFTKIFGTPNVNSDKVISYYANIAASIQAVTEEVLIKMSRYIKKKTNLDYLCYAGGVALNSSANWKIFKESGFKEIFIQPAAGDSGGSLGAALWASNTIANEKNRFTMDHAYWGKEETDKEICEFLNKENIKSRKIKNENLLIEEIVEKLAKGKVAGIIQGRAEWGPRALGHRSIIADPRSLQMKETVNKKIKFREAFRPFAPSVIEEDATKYFRVPSILPLPLKYMLYVVPVMNNEQENLRAITHVDGTARPQIVEKKINPLYHELISQFGKKTGVNAILNTSFNLKGEPIVNTAKEAYLTFLKSGIDFLVIHDRIIEKV